MCDTRGEASTGFCLRLGDDQVVEFDGSGPSWVKDLNITRGEYVFGVGLFIDSKLVILMLRSSVGWYGLV
ncbi:hypothetical protein ADUPG1_002352, partial [Aduncisulcus paluster]